MCVVKQIEVPNVETRFFHDVCECHPEPVEMVELRGSDSQSTVVYRVDKVRKMPGHWAAIRQRYAEWKEPTAKPLLLTHRRDRNIAPTVRPAKHKTRPHRQKQGVAVAR
jgi:hypothetical protein